MTDYETRRAMLQRAMLPLKETTGISGLSELHIETDEGAVVIEIFDADGALLAIEVDGMAEAEEES